ncbi:MAG: tetratricopeptide repeat protein [Candidatus Edwardsbacteria bacterium]|nr:tetratricopeptide repeat protein [Candidatus Edwardsbacteria bacterium]
MKRTIMAAAIAALCAAALPAQDAPATIAKADELTAQWFVPEKAQECYQLLKAAAAADTGNFDLQWRLARICFKIADRSNDSELRKRIGKEGYQAGHRASRLKPERVEGYFWGGVALGKYSEGTGILKSIKEGNKGKYERMIDGAIKIDKLYDDGGPLRAKGLFYARLPWPMRDRSRAMELLNQALQAEGKHARTTYYMAEVLYDDGKYPQCQDLLNQVLDAPFQGDDEGERQLVKGWAQEMLQKVEAKLK